MALSAWVNASKSTCAPAAGHIEGDLTNNTLAANNAWSQLSRNGPTSYREPHDPRTLPGRGPGVRSLPAAAQRHAPCWSELSGGALTGAARGMAPA